MGIPSLVDLCIKSIAQNMVCLNRLDELHLPKDLSQKLLEEGPKYIQFPIGESQQDFSTDPSEKETHRQTLTVPTKS